MVLLAIAIVHWLMTGPQIVLIRLADFNLQAQRQVQIGQKGSFQIFAHTEKITQCVSKNPKKHTRLIS
jgi:hypothetical protein